MTFKRFIQERTEQRKTRYKTINVDEKLHLFVKQIANHYNLALSDLIYNIVSDWKEEHQDDIKEDMRKNL